MRLKRVLATICIILTLLSCFGAGAEGFSAVVSGDNSPVREGATSSSKLLGKLDKGTVVTVEEYKDGIAKISYNGKTGYMLVSDLQKVESEIKQAATQVNAEYAVKSSSLKVYKSASTKAKVLKKLKKNTVVYVVAVSDGWAQIKSGNNIGYVKTSGLKEKEKEKAPAQTVNKTMYVTATSAKLFKTASTKAKKITVLKQNKQVTVTQIKGEWAYLTAGSKKGYMQLKYLSDKQVTYPTINETQSVEVKTTKKLTVYTGASTNAPKAGTVKKGVKLILLGTAGDWALVKNGNNKGYVKKNGLKEVAVEKTTAYTVVASSAVVYEKNKTSSKKLGTYKLGSTLNGVKESGGWLKVKNGTKYGYVKLSLVSKFTFTELKSGDSGDNVSELGRRLETLGYMDAPYSKSYNTYVVNAVKRFQQKIGVSATGTATNLTQQVLFSDSAPKSDILSASYKKGNINENVKRIQTRLIALNYLDDTVDGEYGDVTVKAVTQFQKVVGLSATGTCDSNTLSKLFAVGAKTNTGNPATGTTNNNSSSNSTGKWKEDMGTTDPCSGTASAKIEALIAEGLKKLGCKYVWGTFGPNTFDCSGFVHYCFGTQGVTTRNSAQSIGYGSKNCDKITKASELKRGDIVCFNSNSSDDDLSDHVGIYLGNSMIIHASSSAGKVVISQMSSGFFQRTFSWGIRIKDVQ